MSASDLERKQFVQIINNDIGTIVPDTFLKAAQMLDTEPERAVVVEDAISGVQAGRAGNFGMVIGVDRHGEPDSLRDNGADIVVDDLDKLLP